MAACARGGPAIARVLALVALAACCGGGAGARLSVHPGTNASCPWRVVLAEGEPQFARVEFCTSALPVAFEDSLTPEESPGVMSGAFSQRSLLARPTDSSSSASQDSPLEVPVGYTRLPGGGIYKVHEEKATWMEARATCEAEGAHLVILNSKEEATALKLHFESRRRWWRERPFTFHAGFYMEFVTSSGRKLSSVGYERWAPREPAGPLCGRIDHDAWLLFGQCSQHERFVCEFHNATQQRATEDVPREPQPSTADLVTALTRGYSEAQQGSYTLYKWKTLTVQNFNGNPWEDARQSCRIDGAQLAVVESQEEAESLRDFFQELPVDEPYGDTLVGLRTKEPVTVLGLSLARSGYNRWVKKGFPESCLCMDIKVSDHTKWRGSDHAVCSTARPLPYFGATCFAYFGHRVIGARPKARFTRYNFWRWIACEVCSELPCVLHCEKRCWPYCEFSRHLEQAVLQVCMRQLIQ